jgi:hypothetical protein
MYGEGVNTIRELLFCQGATNGFTRSKTAWEEINTGNHPIDTPDILRSLL